MKALTENTFSAVGLHHHFYIYISVSASVSTSRFMSVTLLSYRFHHKHKCLCYDVFSHTHWMCVLYTQDVCPNTHTIFIHHSGHSENYEKYILKLNNDRDKAPSSWRALIPNPQSEKLEYRAQSALKLYLMHISSFHVHTSFLGCLEVL